MKIESIIKRNPPTEIELDGTVYKFQPDEHGRHVAEVTDKRHIARLLSIAEGYQLPGDEPLASDVQAELDRAIEERSAPVSQPVLTPTDDDALRGSTVHPATIDLGGGKQVDIDDVIDAAYEVSGLTTAEWNALADEDRHKRIDATLDAMAGGDDTEDSNDNGQANGVQQPPATPDPKPADDKAQYEAERDAVAQEYKAKFGKLPHYKWTIEKIREELAKPAPGEGAE